MSSGSGTYMMMEGVGGMMQYSELCLEICPWVVEIRETLSCK